MLRSMRKHGSKWVLGFLVVIISVVFIFTFSFSNKGEMDRTVVEVGSHKITMMEYREAFDRTLKAMRTQGRNASDADRAKIREAVIDGLIDRYVFLAKAADMGLAVTDREYADYLATSWVYNKEDGTFDEKLYLEFVRRSGLDRKTYEENQRQALLIQRLISIIQDNDTSTVDEKGAFEYFIREKGQVKLSVAVFDPDAYKSKVAIDDKELAGLYEREKGAHKSENTYHLRYLAINDGSGVKDDQVYMDLLKSKDLAAYGKMKGLEVVDLGTMKESELISRFGKLKMREGLKGLVKGDVTLPMRTDTMSFIFQVVDREEGKLLDRAEAVKEIRARIAAEKARTMARTMAEDGVKDKGLKFARTTEFIPRSSTSIPGIGPIPAENAALFALSKGQVFEKPVEVNGKFYVFAYADEKQPDKAQWEKEKVASSQIYKMKRRDAFFAAFREDMRKAAKVKYDLKDM